MEKVITIFFTRICIRSSYLFLLTNWGQNVTDAIVLKTVNLLSYIMPNIELSCGCAYRTLYNLCPTQLDYFSCISLIVCKLSSFSNTGVKCEKDLPMYNFQLIYICQKHLFSVNVRQYVKV